MGTDSPLNALGGVMVTLAALCLAQGLNMHAAGETELERISQPEIIQKTRLQQATKPRGSPLPQIVADSKILLRPESKSDLDVIRAFVSRVNKRAESNMLKTGKLEGSHYAAMTAILAQMEKAA